MTTGIKKAPKSPPSLNPSGDKPNPEQRLSYLDWPKMAENGAENPFFRGKNRPIAGQPSTHPILIL